MEEINVWSAAGGLVLGLVFGTVVQRSRFCVVAAVGNWLLIRDGRHLNALFAAIVVALIGTQLIDWGGLVALSETGYRSARMDWFGALAGGLVFGFGTVLAGGCVARISVRVAEGDGGGLLALVVFALAAYASQYGFLSTPRVWLIEHTAIDTLAWSLNVPTLPTHLALVMVGSVALHRIHSHSQDHTLTWAGAVIGLLVVGGWWVTGTLAQDDFNPITPASLTFSGPLAQFVLFLAEGQVPAGIFGVTLVGGTLLGACASSILSGSFQLRLPGTTQAMRCLGGGVMMGIGAMMAGGCNIGQITGISTGAIRPVIAMLGILGGIFIGMYRLSRRERV